MTEKGAQAVDRGDHGVPFGNSQSTTGQEVTLHVDHEQHIITQQAHLG